MMTADKLTEKIADFIYRIKIEPARDSHNSMAAARRIMEWVERYRLTAPSPAIASGRDRGDG